MPNRFERHLEAARKWVAPIRRNTDRLIRANRPTLTPRAMAAYSLACAGKERASRYVDAARYHLDGVRPARMKAAPLP